MLDKQEILKIVDKLKKQKLIKEIEESKYSIQILINCDDDFEEDSYLIRNIIKQKFKDNGNRVEILGTYWLDIYFYDVRKIIDECFKGE